MMPNGFRYEVIAPGLITEFACPGRPLRGRYGCRTPILHGSQEMVFDGQH
jgi:hypothetical protein